MLYDDMYYETKAQEEWEKEQREIADKMIDDEILYNVMCEEGDI